MLVVPTQEQVRIDFRDRLPETAGKLITLGTLAGLAVVGWRRRRDRMDGRDTNEAPLPWHA
jgi:hypothetical protein